MTGKERRNKILDEIKNSSAPVSGSKLASDFGISRQVVVQDIALLRTAGHDIISTNRGYILSASPSHTACTRVFKVLHTDDQIEDELCSIVDLGGTVLDVFVSHKTYGLIKAELNIRSRLNVREFLAEISSGKSRPLKNITESYHYHTVSAENHEILDMIHDALLERGFLAEIDAWDAEHIVG